MDDAATQTHASRPTYLKVFAFLAVLTAIEVSVAFLIGTAWLRIAFLAVLAIAKAGLVIAFYMHLRFERIPLRIIALGPLVLVLLLASALLLERSLPR
jgi:cytochrome c oxidase subunit IV